MERAGQNCCEMNDRSNWMRLEQSGYVTLQPEMLWRVSDKTV